MDLLPGSQNAEFCQHSTYTLCLSYKTLNVTHFCDSCANHFVIFQMSLSLHLNAHNINFCIVIYGCAYRETAMLNLIASPEMFETYFVPEETEGGPGQRTGKGATLSQQAETHR